LKNKELFIEAKIVFTNRFIYCTHNHYVTHSLGFFYFLHEPYSGVIAYGGAYTIHY